MPLTPAITAELRKAWARLGGSADMFDSVIPSRPLRATFAHAGADADLLTILASYGDTMGDEWVLGELRRWNAAMSEA